MLDHLYEFNSFMHRFKLEYDHCNRILRTKIGAKLLPMGAEDMAKSFSAEYMQKMPKRDGPFSQVPTSYTEQTGDGNMIVSRAENQVLVAFH